MKIYAAEKQEVDLICYANVFRIFDSGDGNGGDWSQQNFKYCN